MSSCELAARRHFDQLAQLHAADRRRTLERDADAEAGALVDLEVGKVDALEEDAALGHPVARHADDRVEQGGLAAAVGAEQDVRLALIDGEIDAAQDLTVANGDVQVFDLQQGCGLL